MIVSEKRNSIIDKIHVVATDFIHSWEPPAEPCRIGVTIAIPHAVAGEDIKSRTFFTPYVSIECDRELLREAMSEEVLALARVLSDDVEAATPLQVACMGEPVLRCWSVT
jgi:hypothetical protein